MSRSRMDVAQHSIPLSSNDNLMEKPLQDFYQPVGSRSSPAKKRSKWLTIGLPVLLLVVIAGAVVGGVVGSRSSNSNNKSSQQNAVAGDDAASSVASDPVASSPATQNNAPVASETASPTSSAAPAPTSVTPLPKFNFLNSDNKMLGMSLGSWLLLEPWMMESWITENTGLTIDQCPDEWTVTTTLGDRAQSLFTDWWNTYVTEDDIELLYQYGFNHLRVPIGYWAFVDNVGTAPYLSKAGQMEQITRIAEYAYKRGMYIMIDMHGLPGSQNGELTTGRRDFNQINFYNAANQNVTRVLYKTIFDWVDQHPYKSVFSSFAAVNEPRCYSDNCYTVLQTLYQWTYDTLATYDDPMMLIFHHAWPKTGGKLGYWKNFSTGKDPNRIMIEDHPYPGNFPPSSDTTANMNGVCSNQQMYANYPLAVAVTEWSPQNGVHTASWVKNFYSSQLLSWQSSGGSCFWSLKADSVNGNDWSLYSFKDLEAQGLIPKPSSPTQKQSDFLATLTNSCSNVNMKQTWTNPSS